MRNQMLKAMLDYRDDRINSVYVDALFDHDVSNQAKWCLIRVGGTAFPEAWVKVESDPRAYALTIYQVWAHCGSGGVREIAKGLYHSQPLVRRETVRAYAGHIFPGDAAISSYTEEVSEGIRKLFEEPDAVMRGYVLRCIERFGESDRNELLLKAITDSSYNVRALAAELMYFCTDARKEDALLTALGDVEPVVREKAALALDAGYYVGTASALRRIEALINALGDRAPAVKRAALSCLSRWVDPRGWFGHEVRPPTAEQTAVVEAIRSLLAQRRLADTAYSLLANPVCEPTALAYLAYTRDPRIWTRLVQGARSDDYSTSDLSVCLLGLYGDKRALPILREMLTANKHRDAAEKAIAQIEAAGGGPNPLSIP